MSGKDKAIKMNEERLHAYVDGFLDPKEVAEVEAFLEQNPEMAQQVADWKRQNDALNQMFLAGEAEQRTTGMVDRAAHRARLAPGSFLKIAAAVALVAVGTATGWYVRGAVSPASQQVVAETLVREAIVAHAVFSPEVLHPVEVDASQETHLIGWLSKRLGAKISAPDLSGSGYQLVGGRLLPADGGPAAQFMYENDTGERITVYATTGSQGALASFQFDSFEGFSGVFWQDERLRYAVVGPLDREQLGQIAVEVYRQLI